MQDNPITLLLGRVARGDKSADELLAAAVVRRLEQIAGNEMAARNRGGLHGLTLEPAILAHDALLKILEHPPSFENRRHFFAYATQVMARAMIDYQRQRGARKRGGDQVRVTLSGLEQDSKHELADVPDALDALDELDQRKADLVRLRVFWGASMQEAAQLLNISLSSAERDWRFARRWLATRLNAGSDGDEQ